MNNSSSSWVSSKASTLDDTQAKDRLIVCNMLATLSISEKQTADQILLAMSNGPAPCQALRRAGCIPLLIPLVHPLSTLLPDQHPTVETQSRALRALQNIVEFNPDEKLKERELRILRLLDPIRQFITEVRAGQTDNVKHPTVNLMLKEFSNSKYKELKAIFCQFGGVEALADFIVCDTKLHGQPTDDCIMIRSFLCVALANIIFEDPANKALLCSMNEFMVSLVSLLRSDSERLVAASATVLRNLAWRAESRSKKTLSDVAAIPELFKAAMRRGPGIKEKTLKDILHALWNLSLLKGDYQADICSTPNALAFLMSLLQRNVEYASGILRNISAHIVEKDCYRNVLAEKQCLKLLLNNHNLNSTNGFVRVNVCETLWNLSSHPEEQRRLLEFNAVPRLKSSLRSLKPTQKEYARLRRSINATLSNISKYYEKKNPGYRNSVQEDDEQPLDLSVSSSRSSPIKRCMPPVFLNPPTSYASSSYSTRSCPSPDMQFNSSSATPKPMADPDETHDYSNYDEEEEEEKCDLKDTIKTYCDEGTPGFSGSMVDLSCQANDTLHQFQVEDTPAVFSRTSSLSSIEGGQQEMNGDQEQNAANEQRDHPESNRAGTSSAGQVQPSGSKRVMFSAEETPLMFSRCSSLESLESCGPNARCESECFSEFSRRESEVVSPSDIPDSPRAGMRRAPCTPAEPNNDANLDENALPERKPAVPTDELTVFAMEGTPFMISTATSLSDLVGDLENNLTITNPAPNPEPSPRAVSPPSEPSQPQQSTPSNEADLDDPIYYDVQLLNKVINKGKAFGLGLTKKLASEEDDVDLSQLIKKGRDKVLNRSHENNLNTCGLEKSTTSMRLNVNSVRPMPKLSPNHNTVINEPDSVKPNNLQTASISGDDTPSQSDEATTWTDNTPSFSTSLASMSINRAMNKVIAREDQALSEVEQPTLASLGTLDSTGSNNVGRNTNTSHLQRPYQLLLQQTSAGTNNSQVSNLMNQKPPQEFFDMDSSMISVASIKSEIFEDGIHSSPTGSQQGTSTAQASAQESNTSSRPTTPDRSRVSSSQRESPPSKDPSVKCDPFVIKRIESPKEKRKNDPDRYLTRTIEKFDLKTKPPVPPKPGAQPTGSAGVSTFMPTSPLSPVSSSPIVPAAPSPPIATAIVKPTRASDLRASRSRDHSPTHSPRTTSNANANTFNKDIAKTPPKPPVRSTPLQMNNTTTLPRNAKLMEGNATSSNCSIISPTPAHTTESIPPQHFHYNQDQLHNNHQVTPMPSKDTDKANKGGIFSYFRKSFTKSNSSSTNNSSAKTGSSSSGLFSKSKKEKAQQQQQQFPTYSPSSPGSTRSEMIHNSHNNGTSEPHHHHHHHHPTSSQPPHSNVNASSFFTLQPNSFRNGTSSGTNGHPPPPPSSPRPTLPARNHGTNQPPNADAKSSNKITTV